MKHMFLTCWACIALIFPALAQREESLPGDLKDTLVLHLGGGNQLRIMGSSMEDIMQYNFADSLKTLFLADLQKALDQAGSKELPREVYYLFAGQPKRRIKMKTEEYAEDFDLNREVFRLQQNLPKHELNLYDLQHNMQMQAYVQDEKALQELATANVLQALTYLKSMRKEVRRHYRYDLRQQLDGFVSLSKQRNHISALEIKPSIGTILIGNVFTPVIGSSLSFNYRDKYNREVFKAGLSLSGYFFTDFAGGKFNKVYSNTASGLFFMVNANERSKQPYYFGVEGGVISKSNNSDGVFRGNPFYLSFLTEYKGFQYSFGYIHYTAKQSLPTVGVKIPF